MKPDLPFPDLDALEALERAATPAPWEVSSGPWVGLQFGVMSGNDCIVSCNEVQPDADRLNATIISLARNALPSLLALARECLALRAVWEAGVAAERERCWAIAEQKVQAVLDAIRGGAK